MLVQGRRLVARLYDIVQQVVEVVNRNGRNYGYVPVQLSLSLKRKDITYFIIHCVVPFSKLLSSSPESRHRPLSGGSLFRVRPRCLFRNTAPILRAL